MDERIIRSKNKTENFTIMLNEIFQRSDISARAKGIYAYIMTLPSDWKIYKSELFSHFSEGKGALQTAFKELEDNGYIESFQERDERGKFAGIQYIIYESSQGQKPEIKSRKNFTGNQKSESGFRQLLNTNKQTSEFSEKLTEIRNIIQKQIKEVIEIPEIRELLEDEFYKKMKSYNPSKKELQHFLEHYDSNLLEYYKPYLIYSILEENLYYPNSNEMVIPRIALFNSNHIRRRHLEYAKEHNEDILQSLKLMSKKENNMDKKKIDEFYKNKPSFSQFVESNNIPEEKPVEEREEYAYLKHLHKLDGKNMDYIDEDKIDDYIEELLLQQ